MNAVGKHVNIDSLARGLDAQVAAGNLKSWRRDPTSRTWSVTVTEGDSYALTGLAQVHAVIIGLRSAQLSYERKAS